VILFFFAVMVQILLIAQAAHLGNYAAYAAARVYAVRASWDSDAEDYAKKAAALAYAPVSAVIPGEVFGMGSPSALLSGVGSSTLSKLASVMEGFGMAYLVRLTSAGGGEVSIERSGSGATEQVDVNLTYACPVWIPGLRELWQLATTERSEDLDFDKMKHDLEPLAPGGLLTFVSPYAYIGIKSKCSIGYEPWSGTPRERQTVDEGSFSDPALKEYATKVKEASDALGAASDEEDKQYWQWYEADEKLTEAQEEFKAVMKDPNSSPEKKAAAQAKLDDAIEKEKKEWGEYKAAKADRKEKQKTLEQLTGNKF
jgi:hypothetical protein